MRKAIDLSFYLSLLAFVLLIGTSVSSYGGIALPSVETGCAKKVNGQFRVWDCESDADCLPSEVCVVVTGVAGPSGADGAACWDTNPDGDNGICDDGEDINDPDGCDVGDCQGPQGDQGPASCPSIIGGSGLVQSSAVRFLSYFQDKESTSELPSQMKIGTAGSIRNLNVVVGAVPVTQGIHPLVLRRNGNDTILRCDLTSTGGCDGVDSIQCVDLNAGDSINLRNAPNGTPPAGSQINHTAVFNGCACCDGDPPVNGTCVRPD